MKMKYESDCNLFFTDLKNPTLEEIVLRRQRAIFLTLFAISFVNVLVENNLVPELKDKK